MKNDADELESRIKQLLADPMYNDHPLHSALWQLWQRYHDHLNRLDRVTRLSDAYQSLSRQREISLSERFEKQVRQLEKVVRISDRYQEMMRDLNVALKEASTHDALTGLANRRLLLERLKEESERVKRLGQPLVVAMLDVDHFKTVNDTYGHEAGDEVLVKIAQVMQGELREYDICGRWGGEEFLLLLPATPPADALAVITRLHQSIQELVVRVGDHNLSVTASIGFAEHAPGAALAHTLKRADDALFQAKRAGRDRIHIASA